MSLLWLLFFFWTDSTRWSTSPPWTNSICLVLMKDSWDMRESLLSWYHFPSIHQWILKSPVRVRTIADVYNLYSFLPGQCLLSWFHVCTERLTLCLMLDWSSQQILAMDNSICFLIYDIMGNGHVGSTFRQTATIWGISLLFHICALNSLKIMTVSSNVPLKRFLFFHRKQHITRSDWNCCRRKPKYCPSQEERGMCIFDHGL